MTDVNAISLATPGSASGLPDYRQRPPEGPSEVLTLAVVHGHALAVNVDPNGAKPQLEAQRLGDSGG